MMRLACAKRLSFFFPPRLRSVTSIRVPHEIRPDRRTRRKQGGRLNADLSDLAARMHNSIAMVEIDLFPGLLS